MGLNADLMTKLDAGLLVQGFLAGITGPAGSLNMIESPAVTGISSLQVAVESLKAGSS